ncbi:DUF4041 domain-containing protein [Methanococcus maripaludis]|uniref:Seryl-tRNA synthetase n=1 Tax=Methanococcus maripaludis TaxID=39152 RepID=A0A2L1C8S4_METMI|nr:DUF4041 domain-containing protein [Methanococcus maripaludis]AVB75744.1 T5orf172 domain protein [Methanococcus maripaludis]MBA2864160.1 seryl-tRNA synthetase [Methanococcus maripaludis]MBB6497086.1 seryl-tRNA synthetase [Methanococcus maripaludis]
MGIGDIFNAGKFKKEIENLKKENERLTQEIENLRKENDELNKKELNLEQLKYLDLKKEIENLESTKKEKENALKISLENLDQKRQDKIYHINAEIKRLEEEKQAKIKGIDLELKAFTKKTNLEMKKLKERKNELLDTIEDLEKKIISFEEEILIQSFGFYDPRYNLTTSEAYKNKLTEVRTQQKEMVKNKKAVDYFDGWELNGSKKEGQKMNNDNIKLIVRSFNNECEASVFKVKYNNIDASEKRIRTSYDTLNKLGERNRITITSRYLNLKLQELYLAYEYELKKREEREEQARIKEQMREEARVLKEIETMKAKIEKEETHFKQAVAGIKEKMENATETQKLKYEEKLRELEEKIRLLEKDKEDVYNREQNTRAGYVYIISNIGSFGDDIYKIGMTRRLEPFERVRELSGASVPFPFDVHAMVFSEDAPKLENALHNYFRDRQLNKVNNKKEFFKVNLHEVEKVVKENHNKVVEFTKIAEAEQYRQSIAMDNKITEKEEKIGYEA